MDEKILRIGTRFINLDAISTASFQDIESVENATLTIYFIGEERFRISFNGKEAQLAHAELCAKCIVELDV